LIPRYQQIGAAAVTSLTELLLLCISFFFVPKYLLPRKSVKVLVKVLLAALAMSLVVLLTSRLSILLIVPIALLVYSGAGVLLRIVPREDVQALLSALGTRGKKVSPQILTTIGDEGIYLQTTEQLSGVDVVTEAPQSPKIVTGELRTMYDDDDDEVTQRRPIVYGSGQQPN
jgi:hypothetical protein